MNQSPSIAKLMPALLKAQRQIKPVEKSANNPFFKSKYADLPAVIESCKAALNENGIVILQPVDGSCVKTTLIHESGEWISDDGVLIVSKDEGNPQAQGSAISYARRYGLMSFLTIPAEDDDGEGAMKRVTPVTTSFKAKTPSKAATTRATLDEQLERLPAGQDSAEWLEADSADPVEAIKQIKASKEQAEISEAEVAEAFTREALTTCADCGRDDVKENVQKFSLGKYGRILCFNCQNKIKQNMLSSN